MTKRMHDGMYDGMRGGMHDGIHGGMDDRMHGGMHGEKKGYFESDYSEDVCSLFLVVLEQQAHVVVDVHLMSIVVVVVVRWW